MSNVRFWKEEAEISKYQGRMLENWNQWLPHLALAPAKLYQEILSRWVVGTQVNLYEFSKNPDLEKKIVTKVAGYGSQLGTIEDCLEVLLSKIPSDVVKSQTEQDAIAKFKKLVQGVKEAKPN